MIARLRNTQGLRVALVSAAFVVLGIVLREEVPWYATAFFAVCLVAGLLSASGKLPLRKPHHHVTIDEVGITRSSPKLREHVAWSDIARIRIVTTDTGPWAQDVFFVVDSVNGDGCVIAHDLAVRGGLLEAFQSRLQGVDSAAVIEAMGSTSNRTFTIWERKDQVDAPLGSTKQTVKVRGRITDGVGDFRVRMARYPDVFERTTGERLFPGTLNIDIGVPLRCREDFRIRGRDIGEPGQDLLFERCLIAGHRAYRIRPFDLKSGGGGHGDHVLEIASAVELRPLFAGREGDIEIEFFRDRL